MLNNVLRWALQTIWKLTENFDSTFNGTFVQRSCASQYFRPFSLKLRSGIGTPTVRPWAAGLITRTTRGNSRSVHLVRKSYNLLAVVFFAGISDFRSNSVLLSVVVHRAGYLRIIPLSADLKYNTQLTIIPRLCQGPGYYTHLSVVDINTSSEGAFHSRIQYRCGIRFCVDWYLPVDTTRRYRRLKYFILNMSCAGF